MVRLKSRYILFEILYPNMDESEHFEDNFSMKNILLRHNKVTPEEITNRVIIQDIRRSLQLNFGDYGSGKASSLLQLKYFSNMTSTGILRCHREDIDLILSALMLIKKLDNRIPIIFNPVKISGTMKKIEQFAIRRSHKLMTLMQKDTSVSMNIFKDVTVDDNND
ncbi:hypothetical protein TPHA_0N00460 [Tetrapisispora phaffii CBS 4417]|uniref:Ribonuclease P/MRP protein subunit POP5 n=1 Tax=Tetrapisispora phaffii (strain ATCC 24235 / CBS 4417 / NBRC 1672 / NRRL Y-8282 / UCD 70-5) TaxID=1071381 RepID=G8C0Z8_TETPH|nr:hypothetical protein TPHA_0N00460 [Tetrapisispora phaffii CBS 4417]CCE65826.1 hypothetical protein TPHA_0N00460 [Tetrapisispora phaffii CBS 4417]